MPRASRTGIRGLFQGKDGQWWIDLRWRDAGTQGARRYRERLPDKMTAAARRDRARAILSSALAGKLVQRGEEARTLKDALDEYVRWRKDNGKSLPKKSEAMAARLLAAFGDVSLDSVSQFAIERFKRERATGGAGPATINRDLAFLWHFYGLAASWGWVSKAHVVELREVSKLKEPPGRVRYLTEVEEAKLLPQLRPHLRRVVVTGLLSGMRQNEIIALRKECVDLVSGTITLTRTKSNRVRRVYVNDPLSVVLQEAMDASAGPFVFVSRTGKPYHSTGVISAFKGAVKRAGIEDFHFHDLRHTCATRIRRSGVGIDVIQQVLGHSTIQMAMRYAHIGSDSLRAAMAALPAPVAHALPTTGSTPTSKAAPHKAKIAGTLGT